MKGNGRVWTVLGIGFLALALCLTTYNVGQANQAGDAAAEAVTLLEELVAAQETVGETQPREESPLPVETLPDFVRNPVKEMPTQTINGYDYIGVLTIPALNLELPVMSTWNYTRLRIAPCRYTGSVYQDNMTICAHNYASHFGGLKNLRIGDSVTFTDVEGNVFSYAVCELETLAPSAVEEMTEGDWNLTLFTCTIGGATRVTVRCDRTEEK